MSQPNPKEQLRLVEEWKHPVGTPVIFMAHPRATPFPTFTCSEPWMLGKSSQHPGHTAVIAIEGRPGCVALDCIAVDHSRQAKAADE